MYAMPTRASARAVSNGERAARIAVAGATGYTGQEVLRLLSRHPSVRVTVATSSGITAARKLPVLGHLWAGSIKPVDADALVHEADDMLMALPDSAAAELGPRLPHA